jgi:hypothetical protein
MTTYQQSHLFDAEVKVGFYEWRGALPSSSRRGTRYIREINRKGAVQAAKDFLHDPTNGRKALRRGEVGIEYFVVKPRFKSLFTAWERAEARRRIASQWAA